MTLRNIFSLGEVKETHKKKCLWYCATGSCCWPFVRDMEQGRGCRSAQETGGGWSLIMPIFLCWPAVSSVIGSVEGPAVWNSESTSRRPPQQQQQTPKGISPASLSHFFLFCPAVVAPRSRHTRLFNSVKTVVVVVTRTVEFIADSRSSSTGVKCLCPRN